MRADGKRAKNVEPMYQVACHIMDKRSDAQNMIELDIPVEPLNEYIRKQRDNGRKITHLALVLASYLRICAEFRQLNYFVVNKKIYEHNDFQAGMVVLKKGDMTGTMSKVELSHKDGIFEVQEKLDAYIEQNRKQGTSNATDRLIKILLKIPGLVRLGVNIFKLLDRFGLLPRKVLKASPFHCTMCISNLASIRLPHIFHHCYNFGTTSVFITLGNQRENMMRTADGIEPVRCLPLGVVMDERICSGSYFGMAFKQMKKYLANPELMEGEPTFELFSK